MREIIPQIHAGIIGKTYFGRGWYVNNRISIGHGKPARSPHGWITNCQQQAWRRAAPSSIILFSTTGTGAGVTGTGEALNKFGTH